MRVEVRTDGRDEIGDRLRTLLDAQVERISRRVPEDSELTVELRVDPDAEPAMSHVAELKLRLPDGELEASEAAASIGRAVKVSAASLTRQLKALPGDQPKPVKEFPARTPLDLGATVREYWLERVSRHTRDSYAGVRMAKFPEDLRVYEHLLWASKPNVVIEIGTLSGGSALWFRDRLRTLADYGHIGDPLVISIDLDIGEAREAVAAVDPAFEETIKLLAGDITDPELPGRVEALLPKGARCLVVEDSAHVFETTMAALLGFAHFVPERGFFVVEDGSVDREEMRLREDWPRGVLPAVRDWLETEEGRKFRVRRDLEIYGITSHPEGFLERTAA
jgi:cephalosporin hydroxylase/ribosome-associated translation inhibitor RaiA